MKNVGRYPDLDTSLAHRALSTNRLSEVSMTPEAIQQQLDARISNYVTESDVAAQTSGKLASSELGADVGNYFAISDVGANGPNTGVASLVNGKIPTSQLPSRSSEPKIYGLESDAPTRLVNVMNTSTAYDTTPVQCGMFSLTDPGYAWIPIISGSIEVNITSGNPPAVIKIKDSEGRVVAGGWSTRRAGFNRVHINPENLEIAYLGTVYFYFWLSFASGTGQVRSSSWEDSIMPLQVPWNG